MTVFNAICGKPARWNGVVSGSTLAFLALLGAASANSQHSTDRGTNDSGALEWGPTTDGVRTGLSATAPRVERVVDSRLAIRLAPGTGRDRLAVLRPQPHA